MGEKTAIYISHRLSSCKFCDRIAVFSKDRIKEYGTHDELSVQSGSIYGRDVCGTGAVLQGINI